MWDVDTGQELRQFTGRKGAVVSVAYSPDRRQIIVASKKKILTWTSSIDELLFAAQRRIQRDPPLLKPEERRQYELD